MTELFLILHYLTLVNNHICQLIAVSSNISSIRPHISLIFIITSLILIMLILLMSDELGDSVRAIYRHTLRTYGSNMDESPIARKIAVQAAINADRHTRGLDLLNYKEFHPPVWYSLTRDERIRLAIYLSRTPVSEVLSIDPVHGNITYYGSNNLLMPNLEIFWHVNEAERRSRRI